MILGCDIGTGVTKGVLMDNGELKHWMVVPTEANPDRAVKILLDELEREKQLSLADLEEVSITGWGESRVSLDHRSPNLLNCVGRGAVWSLPTCRSVLHLGAQQSLLLSINDKGRVMEYRMNDKCAAGAGRYLEVISGALELKIEDVAEIVKKADKELTMSSQCAVFGESEVVSRVNDGESVANIMAAVLKALARSIATLVRRLKIRKDCLVSGGLAKNEALIGFIQDMLEMELKVFQPQPDIIAAIGAALYAKGGQQ